MSDLAVRWPRAISLNGAIRSTVAMPDKAGRVVVGALIGLLLISLTRPTHLPIQVASWVFWLALVIAPGYLLAEILTWRMELDWLERLGLSFPLGLAVMAPVGEFVMVVHLNVYQLAAGWTGTAVLVLLVWLWRTRLGSIRPAYDKTSWGPDEVILIGLLVAAFAYIYPLLTEYKIDGDTYSFLAYIADPLSGLPFNAREPLFSTELANGVRTRYHMFMPLWTMWTYWPKLQLAELTAVATRPMLAVWFSLSSYVLAKASGRTRRFALFATAVQMLIFLAAPFFRDDNIRVFFLTRTYVDKITVSFTMLPVVFACVIHWMRERRWGAWMTAAGSGFALSTIHPLIAAMAALGIAMFGGIHLLFNLRSKAAWIKVWIMAGVVGVIMVIPMIQLIVSIYFFPLAPTYPKSFNGWPVATWQVPFAPGKTITGVDVFGPQPDLANVQASDANSITNPFLLWRWSVNQPRDRLVIFDLNKYISNPRILLEPAYVLALLLIPLLLIRIRSDLGDQLAVGATFGAIFVMYNPIVTPIIGGLVVPWLMWRFIWMPPWWLIIARGVQRLIAMATWIFYRIPRMQPAGSFLRVALPVVLIAGVAFIAKPYAEVNVAELFNQPSGEPFVPTPLKLLDVLKQETDNGPDVIVAADDTTSMAIPAYAGKADVIGYRIFNTSETFPATQQDRALQRVIDQHYIYMTPVLTSRTIEILRRYDAKYMVVSTGGNLDLQLRSSPQWFQWMMDDKSFSLYKIPQEPTVTASIRANDALNEHRWQDARQLFLAAIQADPSDSLAHAGLASTYQAEGRWDLALSAMRDGNAAGNTAVVHYQVGQLLAATGKNDAAIDEFNAAIKAAPEGSLYHQGLGTLCLQMGKEGCADQEYQATIDAQYQATPAHALVGLGDLWHAANRNDKALGFYQQALKLSPDQSIRLVITGRLLQLQRPELADPVAKGLVKEDPGSSDYRFALGNVQASANQIDLAKQTFSDAVQIQSLEMKDTISLRVSLAEVLLSALRPSDAKAQLDQAIQLRDHGSLGYAVEGNYFARENQDDQAIAAYTKAVSLNPNEVVAYLSAGQRFGQQVQPDLEEAILQQGIANNPDVPLLYLSTGNLARTRNDTRAAITNYNIALAELGNNSIESKIAPATAASDFAEAYSKLAGVYEDQGQLNTSMDYYHAAANVDYGDAWPQVQLGDALWRQGDFTGAEVAYNQSIKIDPKYVEGYVRLADLQSARGDTQAATALYQKSKQIFQDQTAKVSGQAIKAPTDIRSVTAATGGLSSLFGQYGAAGTQLGSADEEVAPSSTMSDAATQDLLKAYNNLLGADDAGSVVEGIAHVYQKLNQNDEAVQLYQQQIQNGEKDHWAPLTLATFYKGLGDVYTSQQKHDLAIDNYRHAIVLDPWWSAPRAALAGALDAQGQKTEALNVATDATKLMPGDVDVQIALGKALESTGNYAKAETVYVATAQAHPGSLSAHLALGRSYLGRSQWTDAAKAINEGIAVDPGYASGYVALGDLAVAQGSFADADGQYRRAIQIDHSFTGSYLGLGGLQAIEGHYNDALATYQLGKAVDPTDWRWLSETGVVQQSLGLNHEAETSLRNAAVLGQTSEPLQKLAALYRAQNQPDQAEKTLQQALAISQYSPSVWVALGDLQLSRGRTDDAIATYQRAIAAAPESSAGYAALGKAQIAAGQYEAGLATLKDGTTHAPQDIGAWVALGGAQLARDQRDQAFATYRAGLQPNPNATAGQVALGLAQFKLGRFDDAIATLEADTRINPGDSQAFIALGQAYEAKGDKAKAMTAYQSAIAVAPTDPSPYGKIEKLDLEQRQADEALQVSEQLSKIAPGLAAGYVSRGETLAALGRESEATVALRQGLAMEPGDVTTAIALAKTQLQFGRFDAAAQTSQTVLQGQPNNVDALVTNGQIQLRQSQWAAAEQSFRAAAQADRGRADGELALGDLIVQRGAPDDAISAYKRGVTADPLNVAAYISLGEAYTRYGPTSEAQTVFTDASLRFPWVATPYVQLAQYWRSQGEIDNAQSTYLNSLVAAPRDPAGYVGKAAQDLAQNDYASALMDYRTALSIAPTNAGVRLAYASLLLDSLDRAGALREVNQALADSPDDPSAFVTLATVRLAQHDYDGASMALDRAAQLNPSSADIWLTRSQIATQQGRLPDAQAALDHAVDIAPGVSNVWLAQAAFQLDHGSGAAAIESFHKGVSTAPAESGGYVALSRALASLAKWSEAQDDARAAIAANRGDGATYAAQANVYELLGQYQDAAGSYQTAISYDPGYAPSYVGLGGIRAKQGDFAAAIDQYRRNMAIPTAGVDGYIHLGNLYLQIGPAQKALDTFNSAQSRDEYAAGAHVGIGSTLQHLGRLNEALGEYEKATQIDPYGTSGYVALADGQSANAEFAAAQGNYRHALSLANDDIQALGGLANLQNQLGQTNAALETARKGVASHSDDAEAPQAFLQLGNMLLNQQQYADAEGAFRTAIQRNPATAGAEGYLGLAQIEVAQKNISKARSSFGDALKAGPENASIQEAWGEFLVSQNDWAPGGQAFDRAIALTAGEASGYVGQGHLYAAWGKPDQAEQWFRKGVAAQPGSPDAHTALADTIAPSKPVAAMAEYREALRVQPRFVEAYVGLGDVQVAQATFGPAIDSYQRNIASPISGVDGYVHLGNLYQRIGPADKALDTFNAALARSPNSLSVHVGLGSTLQHLGRPDNALAEFTKATTVDPNNAAGFVALAQEQVTRGDFDTARATYQKALSLAPSNVGAASGLAHLESTLGNQSRGRTLVQTAVSLHQDDAQAPQAYLALGSVLSEQQQYKDAAAAFREAMRRSPATSSTQAYLGLAQIQAAQKQYGPAKELFASALKSGPNDSSVWQAWGLFLTGQKDYGNADMAFGKAIALAGGQASGYLGRGRLQVVQGRVGDAETTFRKAIAVQGGSADAHVNLGRVLAGQPDLAVAEFQTASRVEANFAQAYVEAGDYQLTLGNVSGAVSAYTSYETVAPASATGLIRLAEAYRESGDIGSAKNALVKAAAIGPASSADTSVQIGNVYFAIPDYDNAIAAYQTAKKLDPTLIAEQTGLVRSFIATNHLDWAVGQAREAVHLFPTQGEAWVLLGNALEKNGDTTNATAMYNQAIAADSTFSQPYFELGGLQRLQRMPPDHIAPTFEAGLAISPEDDSGYEGLAKAWADRHIWEAVTRYTALVQASPSLLWPQRMLGQAYEQWAQTQNALDAYKKAQVLDPGYASLYCRRGVLSGNLSQYDDARTLLATCYAMSGPPPAQLDARQSLRLIIQNHDNVRFTTPTDSANVSGVVSIQGTATDSNFEYYKLEYQPVANSNTWTAIGGVVHQAVTNGLLGTWDTHGLAAGDYVLRLSVVDGTGQVKRPTEITVHLAQAPNVNP